MNCFTVWGDFSAWEKRHISCCNQGTLSIILGVLITCIMLQMNKTCHTWIILLVSWSRMSLELPQIFVCEPYIRVLASQGNLVIFLSALGPQSMDTKIIKHSLSFIYSLCNWYLFSFPFSLNFLYWTQTVLYTENDCLSINKITAATLQSLLLWRFLLFSTLFFSESFRDSLSCSLLWVFLQLIFF